jgi:hypothetical protein
LIGEFYIGGCTDWAALVLDDQDLPAPAKYLALALAKYMCPMGRLQWPGKAELAKRMGVSAAAVEKNLEVLRDTGWLKYMRNFQVDPPECVYRPTVPTGRSSIGIVQYEEILKGEGGPIFRMPPKEMMMEIWDAQAVNRMWDMAAAVLEGHEKK